MSLVKRIRRWLADRCDHCGHRFHWSSDPRHSRGNRDGKVWHGPCLAYLIWQSKAEERLSVLGHAVSLSNIDARDLTISAELTAHTDEERTARSNEIFRVMRDLDKLKEEAMSYDGQ